MKKVFNIQAWVVKDDGTNENVTDRFDSDDLKGEILQNLMGQKAEHFYCYDKDFNPVFLMTSAVVHKDCLELNIYKTEIAYLRHKAIYGNKKSWFFNF